MDLHYLQLVELADLLRRREVTSVEVTRAQLERIEVLESRLTSYARIMPDQALAAAERADAEIAAGRYRGPLHGVPLGIKDLFWTKGVPTAAGSTIFRDFVPVQDATAVGRLRHAGAILLGKLQMTEGAYSDHHPAITPPKNPWNAGYWTGISSSGAAAATAGRPRRSPASRPAPAPARSGRPPRRGPVTPTRGPNHRRGGPGRAVGTRWGRARR